ncbi:C4-dicarboxylate ABC transporter permease [Betaproteobacteria bacterium SCGC AG-212-J23]|nr:C4-dicarboxylate ABC transporter permease [Betaproteobacteria bacterium SCGC AG-212-J23]
MRRFLDRLYTGSGVLAALCVFGIFALMMAQALGREAGVLVRGADDIVSWLCAAASFLALGHTFRHGELVRVGLLLDHLGPRGRRWMEIFALGLTALFVAYMLWAVCSFIYDSWKFNEVAQGLIKVPIWIPQMSFLIGVAIFFVAVLDELVLVLKRQKPAYQVAEEERRASGDFSETV